MRVRQSKQTWIFLTPRAQTLQLARTKPSPLPRLKHTTKIIHRSHCNSLGNRASNERPVWDTQYLKAGRGMWSAWVKLDVWKTGVFEAFKCGKQEAGACERRITSGPSWIPRTWNEACVCPFCCVKDTGDRATVGATHTPNNISVKHCTFVRASTLRPPHRDERVASWPRVRAPFWTGGSVFEAPFFFPRLSDPFSW